MAANSTTENGSVTALVKGIIDDAQVLFKQQLELVKHDLHGDVVQVRDAGLKWGAGVAAAAVGGVMVANMVVFLLPTIWPELQLWASYGIVGVALWVLAGVLFWSGKIQFDSLHLLPPKSAHALQENIQCITHPTTTPR
jgi:hypothetical protein